MFGNQKLKNLLKVVVTSLLLAWPVFVAVQVALAEPVSQSVLNRLPEGNDFATRVLRDPWDMNEFSDVSQYLNESGQRSLVADPMVTQGVFSGTSVGDVMQGNAYFFPLFPGYETAMLIGKVGHRYPIDANQYRCLNIAMKVDSGAVNEYGPDQLRVFWFADEKLTNGTWGVSRGIPLYPEAGGGTPEPKWKLFSFDLSKLSAASGASWTDLAQWEGLRIDPTIQEGVSFSVDWVRLTDCAPVNLEVNWRPVNGPIYLWATPSNRDHKILLTHDGIDGGMGTYNLDLQGLEPGEYSIGMTEAPSNDCYVEELTTVKIEPAPIVKFTHPSFARGEDYAEDRLGDPWDFSNASDVVRMENAEFSFVDDVLHIETPSGALPCGVDVQFDLNTAEVVEPGTHYRYLSFRMYTSGQWQNVPEGMMARWIWTIPSLTGQEGYECHFVSHDIPYDVGWQTYTIDLYEDFNGSVEEFNPGCPHCPNLPQHWSDILSQWPVIRFRFDPNENIMGHPIVQEVDWIRLTKAESVVQGEIYPIGISINGSEGTHSYTNELEGADLRFYYTTDPSESGMKLINSYSSVSSDTVDDVGPYKVYLPLVMSTFNKSIQDHDFVWDTQGVEPGEYHICVEVTNEMHNVIHCSEAPLRITAP
jgi:hypothetical protein